MKRREFIAATAALLVSPRCSLAQAAQRRIGFLALNELIPTWQNAWLDGLRNHGWIEGKNLIIEYRYARSQDRLPDLAVELAALSPDLIIAANPQAASALKAANIRTPIVFVAIADPVGIGFVQSLARPGGNMTGLATFVPGEFISKQIEIMQKLISTASKLAILANPNNPIHKRVIAEELPQTARKLGIVLPIVEATTAEEIDIAFASAESQHADGMIVFGDALISRNSARTTALAIKHRLPAMYLGRQYVTGGGLISYGPDFPEFWRHAGGYVDKILKGTKPSDVPVEQPTKFELIINLKTAQTLGLTVPPFVLATADEVIE